MSKPLPKWDIWKHVPTLTAVQAIALTFGIDPFTVHKTSKNEWVYADQGGTYRHYIKSFTERLFLFTECFGGGTKITLKELAKWSQSVGWNIPLELAEFYPLPPAIYEPASDVDVDSALKTIIVPSANINELRKEIENEGCQFISLNGIPTLRIPDGTVQSEFVPLEKIYSAVSRLFFTTKNERIGRLVKNGSSGGGGTGSNYRPQLAPPNPAPALAHTEAAPATGAAKMEAVPKEKTHTMHEGDWKEQARVIADECFDHATILAALFDPVPVEFLEKMFPADGKWKAWADKANANGLKAAAKEQRGRFNPYKAGVWFVSKGAKGWDNARLNRVLANNLPARSRDDVHLLTSE